MNKLFNVFESIVDPFVSEPRGARSSSVYDFFKIQTIGFKRYIFLIGVLSATTAMIEISIFKFIGDIVDKISFANPNNFIIDNKSSLMQMGLVLLIGLPLIDSLHTLFCNQSLEGGFRVRMLSSMHHILMRQGVSFFQLQSAGKIANTIIQTADSSRLVIVKLASTFAFAFVFCMSVGVLLFSIDYYLLFPILVWLIGYIIVVSYFIPKLKDWSSRQASGRSEVAGQLVDTYSNIATVKLFSHSNAEMLYARKYLLKYWGAIKGQMRFLSTIFIALIALNTILIFGTIAMSVVLWANGLITVGAIAAATAVVLRIYTMSHWIMWETAAIFNNLGVVQDGVKLLSSTLDVVNNKSLVSLGAGPKSISFKNVNFSYGDNKQTINSFSLDIKPGEKVGLIGRSGSGKSTLTKLILKLYEPHSGAVAINGVDCKLLDHESLLDQISVVTQEVELLNRTVRENLVYGRDDVCETEMVTAAKIAEAHHFIADLVDEHGRRGYDANVGVGGARLSGGQRQRIAIARAIIKSASILIFDEATSALDSETELNIMNNLSHYMKDKTVLIVTHRLSGLAKMDRLAVIDNGELIELGSHDELSRMRGLYFTLMGNSHENFSDAKLTSITNTPVHDGV